MLPGSSAHVQRQFLQSLHHALPNLLHGVPLWRSRWQEQKKNTMTLPQIVLENRVFSPVVHCCVVQHQHVAATKKARLNSFSNSTENCSASLMRSLRQHQTALLVIWGLIEQNPVMLYRFRKSGETTISGTTPVNGLRRTFLLNILPPLMCFLSPNLILCGAILEITPR